MEDKEIAAIQDIAEKMLDLMHVPAEVIVSKIDEDAIRVDVQGENLGMLIGYHGETLYALQLLLGLHVQRQLGRWLPVSLEVGDWRAQREARLQEIVKTVAQRVSETGAPEALHPMDAAERRMVHIYISDYPNLESVSEGQGRDRRVVIRPKETMLQ